MLAAFGRLHTSGAGARRPPHCGGIREIGGSTYGTRYPTISGSKNGAEIDSPSERIVEQLRVSPTAARFRAKTSVGQWPNKSILKLAREALSTDARFIGICLILHVFAAEKSEFGGPRSGPLDPDGNFAAIPDAFRKSDVEAWEVAHCDWTAI